jgi:DeoR/GlpR family transcriptional regulator of sugar metabolism
MTVDARPIWRLPQQRRLLIAEFVATHEWATVSEVAECFGVSVATARRDLNDLARRQHIVRVHGGAGRSSGAC